MFKWLFERYNLSNYDAGSGYGALKPNPAVGLSDGTFPIYFKYEEEEDIPEDEDEFINMPDISSKIGSNISKKDMFGTRRDNQSFVSNSRLSLNEKQHTNPVRHGISPYKSVKFSGPAIGSGGSNQAFRTSGPGRKTSGPYGNSRATYPRSDEDLEPLMFGDDIVNKYERSLRKHQRKLKKIRNLLKELDN
jgi:hypothetical protein